MHKGSAKAASYIRRRRVEPKRNGVDQQQQTQLFNWDRYDTAALLLQDTVLCANPGLKTPMPEKIAQGIGD